MAMDLLPIELVDQILGFCDLTKNEQLQLRLVCQAFSISLSPSAFKRVRLSEFTREGFDCILHLSQSKVAKHVTHFEYKLAEYVRLKNIHAVDPLIQLEHYYSRGLAEKHETVVKRMAESVVTHHQVYMQQSDILGTFYDVISLSKALPAFQRLKTVTISRFAATRDAPLEFEACTTRAFWTIIKALQRCDPPIESLNIDSLYPSTLVSVPKSKCEQIWEVVGHLKSLCIWKFPVLQRIEDRDDGWKNAFQTDMILKARNLEVLRIGYAAAEGNIGARTWILEHIRGPRWLSLPYLRVLEMRSPDQTILFQDSLLAILRDHRHTLRELTISGFTLLNISNMGGLRPSPASWTEVFDNLKTELCLQVVELDRLEYLDSTQSRIQRADSTLLNLWRGWLLDM